MDSTSGEHPILFFPSPKPSSWSRLQSFQDTSVAFWGIPLLPAPHPVFLLKWEGILWTCQSVSGRRIEFFNAFPFLSNEIPTSHQFMRPCTSRPAWLPSSDSSAASPCFVRSLPASGRVGREASALESKTCLASSPDLHFWINFSVPLALSKLSSGPSLKILSKLVSS